MGEGFWFARRHSPSVDSFQESPLRCRSCAPPWSAASVPSALAQLLLPAECLHCHRLLPFESSDDVICPICRGRFRAVRPPWCERCGQPEPHFGPCRLCRHWPESFVRARSAVWLDDGARAAVHALKYRAFPRVAQDLAEVMVRHLPPPAPGAAIVPIPLSAERLRRRGYNQSLWLARALARAWRRPLYPELLIRQRDTASQTALTPTARLANVAGAFKVRNAKCEVRNDSSNHFAFRTSNFALVLVDDVFTTGATLAEAARALAAAGFPDVSAVTFGRASIPDFS